MRRPIIACLLIGVPAVATAACSATNSNTDFGAGGAGAGNSTSQGPGPDTATGAGGGLFGTGGSSSSGGCDTHCSSDLHSVVDCNGNVVTACPADQGCGLNGCEPACDSAKDNKSSIGCDYYAVDPDIIIEGAGGCFAAFVANTWGSPISITVERGGQQLDVSSFARIPQGSGQSISYAPLPGGKLPAGQVAVLFLAATGQGIVGGCPAGQGVGQAVDAAAHGTAKGQAFHIATSAPAVLYDIYPYGGGQTAATSDTLLLPTTVWDTNYIAVDAFRKSQVVAEAQPSVDIVALEDGTAVTISPTAAIMGGSGVPATGKGVPATYNLNKGEVLQFSQDYELVGSPIQSNKPIGVWGGATCLSIDVNSAACDSAHQQIPPVKALGSEYVAVRYRNRFDGQEESPPWRMVGAVDGTTLVWSPSTPPSAPTTLNQGQVAEFKAAGPFVVKAQDDQHPFYMSAHMSGCTEVSQDPTDCRGDPEFINVIPPQQYLASYVFFTDPTYPETNLVITRRKTATGFKDVSLDCAGNLSGWQPVGNSGEYEYTRFDLVRHNFAKQGACDNGRHEIKSDGTFGLTVWGWGTAETGGFFGLPGSGFYSQAVSYAYPGGASVQPINTVVVPPTPK
jgi:hypothetical protein